MGIYTLLGLLGLCVFACMTSAKRPRVKHGGWTAHERFPRSPRDLDMAKEVADVHDALERLEEVVVTSSMTTNSTIAVPLSRVYYILTKFTLYSSLHYIQIERSQRNSTEQLASNIDAVNASLTSEIKRTHADVEVLVNRTAREVIREQERQGREIAERLSSVQSATAEINSTFTVGMNGMKQDVEALVNSTSRQLKADLEDFVNRTARGIIRGQDLQKEESSSQLSGVKSDIAQMSSTFISEMSRMKAELEVLVTSVAKQVKTDIQDLINRSVRDITRGQETLRQEISEQLSRVQENVAEINATVMNEINNMKDEMKLVKDTTLGLAREQERHRQENWEQTGRLQADVVEINSTFTRGILHMQSEFTLAVNSVAREVRAGVEVFINRTAADIVRGQGRSRQENSEQLSRVHADIVGINSTFTTKLDSMKEEIKAFVNDMTRDTKNEIEDSANRTVQEILVGEDLQRQEDLEQFSRVHNGMARFNSTFSFKLDTIQSEIQAHISRSQLSMTQQLPQLFSSIAGLNSTMLGVNRNLDSLQVSVNSSRTLLSEMGIKLNDVSSGVAVLGNNVSASLFNYSIRFQAFDRRLDSATTSLVTIKSSTDTLMANGRNQTQLEQRMLQTVSNTFDRIDRLGVRVDGIISSINIFSSLLNSKLETQTARLDAGLLYPVPNVEGGLRLVGGSSLFQGRLEIFHEGRWGTICVDDFGTIDAQVACFSLGMPFSSAVVYSGAHFGRGSDPIWLDNVVCSSGTYTFLQCGHNGWGSHDCSHGEDVGVGCA